jgi:murein DD-endopeptidase MepM/ murein hydrolase activator NlpD
VLVAAGVVAVGQPSSSQAGTTAISRPSQVIAANASSLSGTSAVGATHSAVDTARSTQDRQTEVRERAVSRDSRREALEDAADGKLQAAAEAQAKERNATLTQLAASAEKHAKEIAANRWVLPVSGYRLSARFGASSGLWSSTHTGLDFAVPAGTPIVSVANGVVTSTGWAGAYGNQTVVTHEDGTEV